MAAKSQKNAAQIRKSPVIRKLVRAEEDGRTRLLKRQMPAWLISGLIHFVLIATFIIFDQFTRKETQAKSQLDPPTSTLIDEKEAKEPDPTIPDLGIDPAVLPNFEIRPADEPSNDQPLLSGPPFSAQLTDNPNAGSLNLDPGGLAAKGDGGVGITIPSILAIRQDGPTKDGIIGDQGASPITEAAVARALMWLAKQQNRSGGYWEFDGTQKDNRVAATGMCLLPFLAAGETHMSGKKYKETVARGLDYLKSQMKPSGELNESMYAQAIATVALCEAAGMTQDETLRKFARSAVDFIVKAQAGNGSWGYTAGAEGDTSIIGWQIQALKSARLANIPVPQKTFDQSAIFLENVSSDSGATYGYRSKGATNSMTAVGLLSRQYMGWTSRNPAVAHGVDWMWTKFPPTDKDFNIYYIYYATQVVHFFGGPAWHRDWNPKMKEMLLGLQITDKTVGARVADIGSWPRDNGNGHIGDSCGKLGTTAMCCLTLEVYYRYLPLYKRDGGALEGLEK